MSQLKFMFNLYRIQFRMIFGGKCAYKKEYNEALDILGESGHWLYLYDSLDGSNGDQVCEALKQWLEAFQAKKELRWSDPHWDEVVANEKRLKREVHLLIYGEFTEGQHGYVE